MLRSLFQNRDIHSSSSREYWLQVVHYWFTLEITFSQCLRVPAYPLWRPALWISELLSNPHSGVNQFLEIYLSNIYLSLACVSGWTDRLLHVEDLPEVAPSCFLWQQQLLQSPCQHRTYISSPSFLIYSSFIVACLSQVLKVPWTHPGISGLTMFDLILPWMTLKFLRLPYIKTSCRVRTKVSSQREFLGSRNDYKNGLSRGFLAGSVVKNPPANSGDKVSIAYLGRSHLSWSS